MVCLGRPYHCVKSVRIRSYSGPHFSHIFRIQSECGNCEKNEDQNNSEYGHFLRSVYVSFTLKQIILLVFEMED